jgi:cytochrome b
MMSSKETIRTVSQPADSLVWDAVVRFGHWALVAAFAVAYFSADEGAGGPGIWHVWSGYLIGGIVVLRVLWGFVGSRHARFSDFVYEPYKVLTYLSELLRGRARRYVGHSPAGGAMVIALLACLAATVATGIVAYGEQGKGPLAAWLATDPASATGNRADQGTREGGGESAESTTGELHDLLANITMALVVAHILGVALASFVHRENLVLAMISARKRRARD